MTETARAKRARKAIMTAATELIVARGVDAFSLRETARRSGYAPSALYNHFRNKDELIAAVAMAAVQGLGEHLSRADEGPPLARLASLARHYVAFADDNPQAYRLIFDSLSNPPKTWDEYVGVAYPFTLIVGACAQAMECGDMRTDTSPSVAAYGLWSLVDGHVHLRQKHLAFIEADFDAMFAHALSAYLRGLSTETARPDSPKERS